VAKEEAIIQTKRAQLNELKAKEAEENAIRAANKAEKLRIQQLSRANALAVYEDYDNAQFEIGREKQPLHMNSLSKMVAIHTIVIY